MKYLIAFIIGFSGAAYADIVLSEVILDYSDNKTIKKDITVENIGSKKQYVAIEPAQVISPGDEPIKRKSFKDPRKSNLVVTPNKMVLAPGQKRAIRFIIKSKPKNSDEIYRVRVVPKLGKVKLTGKKKEDEKMTGVKVVVGYDVLVIVRPSNPKLTYKIERVGQKLIVKNTGNTNFLISSITQCADYQKKLNCEKSSGYRVYAGKTKDFSLRRKTLAEVALKFYDKNKIEVH